MPDRAASSDFYRHAVKVVCRLREGILAADQKSIARALIEQCFREHGEQGWMSEWRAVIGGNKP